MSMNTREVVSLQVGHFANFVGTHWWNIQDSSFVYSASETDSPKEVNNDILFREGKTLQGEVTYTPRLMCIDLKGSLNTLRQEGLLYDVQDCEEEILWKNDVTLHKVDVASPNDYLKDLEAAEEKIEDSEENEKEADTDENKPSDSSQYKQSEVFGPRVYDLDDQMSVWSDFLRPYLHPKSVSVLQQYRHGKDEERFDVFGFGREVYRERDFRLELEDHLHFFLEECDNLQGIHLLADCYDGFGGLTSSLVEELGDDYSNKSIVIYSLSPSVFPDDNISRECHRVVNSLLTYDAVIPQSSAFVPLSMASQLWRSTGPSITDPHLQYKPELMYHTSALLASSLENMSLPYRLQSDGFLINHVYDSLVTGGRKVLSAHSCFPLALRTNQNLTDWLLQLDNSPPWQSLTPGCKSQLTASAQSVVLRGVPHSRVTGSGRSHSDPFSQCESLEEVMQFYLSETLNTRLNAIHSIKSPMPTVAPFPHLFTGDVSCTGQLEGKDRPPKQGVTEVSMMTSLQCNQDTASHLESLYGVCRKFNIKKFHRFVDSGLEEDLFQQSVENLASLIHCYRESDQSEEEEEEDV